MILYKSAEEISRIIYTQMCPELINTDIFPKNYLGIMQVMKDDCIKTRSKLQYCYMDRGRLFMQQDSLDGMETNEIMLRQFVPFLGNDSKKHNSVVVARIMFIHRRQGLMTELYKQLESHVKSTSDLDTIVIESVLTESMQKWCLKHKFIESKYYPGTYYKVLK